MNKILYVFNEDLAKQLSSAGYKLHNQGESNTGQKYSVFFIESDQDNPQFLFTFATGEDYVFTNKIFF